VQVTQELGGRTISRASVINFLDSMVDDGILAYTETTGKGGYRRIYMFKHDEAGFKEHIAKVVIRNPKAIGIVEPILKVPQRRMKRSGPMPTIWGLRGHCSDEEVAKAMTLHYRTLSPKYRAAEKVAQTILDEFKQDQPMEVRYSDIILMVKAMKIPYSGPDITDLAAQYLHEKGIKVWR